MLHRWNDIDDANVRSDRNPKCCKITGKGCRSALDYRKAVGTVFC